MAGFLYPGFAGTMRLVLRSHRRESIALDAFLLSPKSRSKIDSCRKAIVLLGCDMDLITGRYDAEVFPGSIVNKGQMFRALFRGSLSPEEAGYLGDACNLPYHRDSRSSIEYGVDLALGWMIEDAVLERIVCQGAQAVLTGHDRERLFLSPREISQAPDLLVTWSGSSLPVEVMCDWLDTWRDMDHLDLRDRKFERLRTDGAVLLGIAPRSSSALVLVAAAESGRFRFNGSIPGYGGKPGYTASGVNLLLEPVDQAIARLIQTIASS